MWCKYKSFIFFQQWQQFFDQSLDKQKLQSTWQNTTSEYEHSICSSKNMFNVFFSRTFLTNMFQKFNKSISKSFYLKYNEKAFQNQLIDMMLNLNLFFRFIEHSNFLWFVNMLRSNIKLSKRIKFEVLVQEKLFTVRRTMLRDLEKFTKINLELNV